MSIPAKRSGAGTVLRAIGGLLLGIAAIGLLMFALEALVAVLEGDAPVSSLLAAGVGLILFVGCARTSWRLFVGRKRAEQR